MVAKVDWDLLAGWRAQGYEVYIFDRDVVYPVGFLCSELICVRLCDHHQEMGLKWRIKEAWMMVAIVVTRHRSEDVDPFLMIHAVEEEPSRVCDLC